MKTPRDAVVAELRTRLERDGSPCLTILLILILAGAVAFLTSAVSLSAGLDSMGLRYFVAVIAGYAAFLFSIRLWIGWRRGADVPNLDLPGSPASAPGPRRIDPFAGGRSAERAAATHGKPPPSRPFNRSSETRERSPLPQTASTRWISMTRGGLFWSYSQRSGPWSLSSTPCTSRRPFSPRSPSTPPGLCHLSTCTPARHEALGHHGPLAHMAACHRARPLHVVYRLCTPARGATRPIHRRGPPRARRLVGRGKPVAARHGRLRCKSAPDQRRNIADRGDARNYQYCTLRCRPARRRHDREGLRRDASLQRDVPRRPFLLRPVSPRSAGRRRRLLAPI
jgi:hypothetical protein